jgi:hypothetical protein
MSANNKQRDKDIFDMVKDVGKQSTSPCTLYFPSKSICLEFLKATGLTDKEARNAYKLLKDQGYLTEEKRQ